MIKSKFKKSSYVSLDLQYVDNEKIKTELFEWSNREMRWWLLFQDKLYPREGAETVDEYAKELKLFRNFIRAMEYRITIEPSCVYYTDSENNVWGNLFVTPGASVYDTRQVYNDVRETVSVSMHVY